MYKLLIIEDEPIERQAIKLMISKNCLQIGQIEEAQDGFAALACCRSFAPDIIMADINMPGLNGLETIRELQNRPQLHAKFLILSSYDRFDYAQEALKLGVEDFILKPAKISRLQEAIAQTVKKLESERQHLQARSALMERMARIRPIVESDCVYALISGDEKTLLDTFFSFLEVQVKSGFCLLVSCEKMPQLLLAQLKMQMQNLGLLVIGQRYNNRLVFFVLSPVPQTDDEVQQVESYVRLSLAQRALDASIAVGGIYPCAAQLHQSYRDARHQQKATASHTQAVHVTQDLRQLAAAQEQLLLSADTTVDAFDGLAQSVTLSTELPQAREMLYRLLIIGARLTEDHCAQKPADTGTDICVSLDEFAQIHTPRELVHCYATHLSELYALLRAAASGDYKGVAGDALRFLNEHYCENIALEDVAAHLQLTANYVSKALKRQTGQNFSDLLTELRIRRAKQLLREALSIKEITYQLGFNSQNYFTKIFKRAVGVTPTEYKSTMGG